MESFGNFWIVLESFEKFLKVLESFGKFRKALKSFGKFWKVLESFGKFWKVLESLEKFRKVFEMFLKFCKVFTESALGPVQSIGCNICLYFFVCAGMLSPRHANFSSKLPPPEHAERLSVSVMVFINLPNAALSF